MENQQYMNTEAFVKRDNDMGGQGGDYNQAPAVKPISQVDKMKLMIIRIGDEKRENVDEHLQKLKAQIVSAYILKDRSHKATITDCLLSCVHVMPHKVNLYSALVAFVAIDDFEFASELVTAIGDSLN
jgi:hypothetical protein